MAEAGNTEKSTGSAAASASSSSMKEAVKKVPTPPREVPPFLQPLTFMGVPKSILTWQPRLPSRNWMIFLSVTSTLTTLYVYDRNQSKKIRQEYKDKVRFLAEESLHPRDYTRKVMVYAAKSPGDDDYDKSLLYFKKYVKPILIAAAIDFETLNGTRHGGLAREIREKIYSRRRQFLNLEPWGTPPSTSTSSEPDLLLTGVLPFSLQPEQQLERELNGGVVIMGRPAFKEWAWGLKSGWTSTLPPARQDLDEGLARELSEDSAFDEVDDPTAKDEMVKFDDKEEADGAGAPLLSKLGTSLPLSHNPAFQMGKNGGSSRSQQLKASEEAGPNVDAHLLEPPTQIPAQPPLYFVDYTNLIGFTNTPRKIVGFFNERKKVRQGGQAALAIALGDKASAREIEISTSEDGNLLTTSPPQGGDLDWGLDSEYFYPDRFAKTLSDIEKSKASFYKELPKRLQETRSYVRGERELTVTERNNPPKSEGELRQERFAKEKDWSHQTEAFRILRKESGVEWHPSFRGSVRVLQERSLHDSDNQQPALT
ncbi:hypothetical protein CBS101457_001456 [Exobasidium rhododendri]|nr:hypothetical protein CBS101457_001456 [Exobasidium rhododendri]